MIKKFLAIFAMTVSALSFSTVAFAAPPSTPEQCQFAFAEGYPSNGAVYGFGCTPNAAYNGPGQIQDLAGNRLWTCVSIVVAADPNTSTTFSTRGFYCRLT